MHLKTRNSGSSLLGLGVYHGQIGQRQENVLPPPRRCHSGRIGEETGPGSLSSNDSHSGPFLRGQISSAGSREPHRPLAGDFSMSIYSFLVHPADMTRFILPRDMQTIDNEMEQLFAASRSCEGDIIIPPDHPTVER